MAKKTCFVIMGFGEKTDYRTGRVLNLDKSYRNLIKPAVESAGLECTRADEIVHSGVIDKPMYDRLLSADVVIADLSTYNCNAFYELGVRHALRPWTTILIAEKQLVYPFDIGHIAIRTYEHMGKGIEFEEVERFRDELREAVTRIAGQPVADSPVYQFLDLQPPTRAMAGATSAAEAPKPAGAETAEQEKPLCLLMDQAAAARKRGDFGTMKSLLSIVRTMRPQDSFVVQQLALATYKSKQPTALEALQEARTLLETLRPETTTNPETLGLWGAVHKRLWDLTREERHLNQSIAAYEKGFHLKHDYYNGINLAFLFNLRAAESKSPAEAITDFVCARRIRQPVLEICQKWLDTTKPPSAQAEDGYTQADYLEDKYWVRATMAEAYLGLGQEADSEKWLAAATAEAPEGWMTDSTRDQLNRLRGLLANSPLSQLALK